MGTRAFAVTLLLVPSLALAQAQGQATLSVTDRTTFDTTQINRAECASTTANVEVKYLPSMSGTFRAGSDLYRFFASTSACSSDVPSSGSFASDVTANDNTNVQTLDVSGGALRAALGFTCTQANDATYYVCVYLVNSGGTVVGTAFSGALTFQMAVPPAPAITVVAPANAALEVTVAQGTTTTNETADTGIRFQVVASAAGYPTVTAPATPTSNTTIRVDNLSNDGVLYQVVASAFSSAGNHSADSAPGYGTPLPFVSFWETYQNAGGREQGGCGGGAGALSLLALLPLALRRRRP